MTATSLPSVKQVFGDNALFASTFLRILDKDKRLVPLRYNRVQRHYVAHRTNRDLVLKARQRGLSTVIQSLIFQQATTKTITSLTLAHDDDSTQALRRISERFYDEFPAPFPKPLRDLSNATITTYPDTGSECIVATAGKKTAGRSLTISLAHLSEVAFWNDAERVMTGLLEAIPASGQVIVESTPNGAQGWFYEECVKALKGRGRFTLHFYPWWWGEDFQIPLTPSDEDMVYSDEEQELVTRHALTPEQIKWRRMKADELGHKFKQEYPEDPSTCFLTSGSSVFTGFQSLLYQPDEQGAMDEHLYVMGIDWSGGGQGDADSHAVSIADATDYREVFLWTTRGRDDDAILAEIVEFVKRWRVIAIVPEFNSMGATLTRRLFKLLNEGGHDWGTNRRGESLEPVVSPVTMTNQTKDELVKDFKAGFKANYKLIDDANGTDELLSFESRQLPSGLWTYGAKSGKHDDTVIARMLCHHACYAHKGY
jgi:hypothetical protein